MKLGDYLIWRGITQSDFADRIKKHRSTVGRWIDGSGRPQWGDIPAITEATEGHVTANDFVDAEGPELDAAVPVTSAA